VLYSLLTIEDAAKYPWNKYWKENEGLYADMIPGKEEIRNYVLFGTDSDDDTGKNLFPFQNIYYKCLIQPHPPIHIHFSYR
jgi:hypothetical protein